MVTRENSVCLVPTRCVTAIKLRINAIKNNAFSRVFSKYSAIPFEFNRLKAFINPLPPVFLTVTSNVLSFLAFILPIIRAAIRSITGTVSALPSEVLTVLGTFGRVLLPISTTILP
jgi:hypothetical protein